MMSTSATTSMTSEPSMTTPYTTKNTTNSPAPRALEPLTVATATGYACVVGTSFGGRSATAGVASRGR